MSNSELKWPETIARTAIVNAVAYSARGGSTNAVHLDANESPWAPPPIIGADDYNRYPEQQPPAALGRLADIYGVSPDQIMLGRGADEAIEVLLRTFCEAGQDEILITPPTFGFYKCAADIQGAKTISAPLNADYSLNVDVVQSAIKTGGAVMKILFLCSPNNPTGTLLERGKVLSICQNNPDLLVVVDEAYAEFSSAPSLIADLADNPNLIILRTLSKAYSMAGVRAGVAIADARIIALLLKVLPPYPIPRPVEKAITQALAPSTMPLHASRIGQILSERARLQVEILKSPYVKSMIPSQTNYILLEIENDKNLLANLQRYGVKIRDFRSKMPNAFRISVGTREENDLALCAFGVAQAPNKPQRIGEAVRTTKETDISVRVNLDDVTGTKISTGNGFFDHMLEALSKHGGFGLVLSCTGDLHIDAHHTIEDCALALGTALKNSLGNKAGIERFGGVIPDTLVAMDETQVRVAVDLSGRAAMTFSGKFPTDHVGEFPSEMCPHFFESLSQTMGAAIQIAVEGKNTHHMIEACFKGLGRALKPAFKRDGVAIPSTKGVL